MTTPPTFYVLEIKHLSEEVDKAAVKLNIPRSEVIQLLIAKRLYDLDWSIGGLDTNTYKVKIED